MNDAIAASPPPPPPFARTLARRARPLGALLVLADADRQVQLVGDTDVAWPDHPGLAGAIAAALPPDHARRSEPLHLRDGLHLLPLAPTEDRTGLVAAVVLDAGSSDALVTAALEGTHHSYGRTARRTDLELADLHAVLLALHADLERQRMAEATSEDLRRQLCFSFEQLMTLYRIGRMVSSVLEPRDFVEAALQDLAALLEFDWYAVQYLPQQAGPGTIPRGSVVHGSLPVSTTQLQTLTDEHQRRNDADGMAGILVPESSSLAAAFGSEVVFAPVHRGGTLIGCLMAGGKRGSDPDPTSIERQLIEAVSDFLGVFHQNLERLRAQQSLTTGTVRALTAAIDAKDPYTRGHSERVGLLTRQICEAMGFDRATSSEAHLAGLLHDVGKIGVPEAVLCKPSRLTSEEFELVKQHPVIGYRILRDIEPLASMLSGVLHHHERIDGTGYPDGLRDQEIPLIARIIAVADGFDAMSSNRAYRDCMPRERVRAILTEGRATQWDAEVVDQFLGIDLTVFDAMIDDHRRQDASHARAA